MKPLSKEFWIVAFFLSKFGNKIQGKRTAPPIELNTNAWKAAYKYFYKRFGKGKSLKTFENSLKNCRDTYDGHTATSERKGWKDQKGNPVKLQALSRSVYSQYNSKNREKLWREIESMTSLNTGKLFPTETEPMNEKKTNPDWTREELILALDLYFDLDQGQMHKGHPDVIRVSNELRELNIHQEIPDQEKFRNPSGISRRLGNFKTMDSGYTGEGLPNSGKLAKSVFKEFTNRRDKLRKEADLIRQLYLKPKSKKVLKKIQKQKNQSRDNFYFSN